MRIYICAIKACTVRPEIKLLFFRAKKFFFQKKHFYQNCFFANKMFVCESSQIWLKKQFDSKKHFDCKKQFWAQIQPKMNPKWLKMIQNNPFWLQNVCFDCKMFVLIEMFFVSPAQSDWWKNILIQKTILIRGIIFCESGELFWLIEKTLFPDAL